jgi:hypothetical protein
MSVFLLGCGSGSDSDSSDTGTTEITGSPPPLVSGAGSENGDDAGHAHPTEGPHGGHLIELGDEEYHAELLHDEATHTVSIHMLDATGKEEITIDLPEITMQLFQDGQFVKYALKAVPGEGGAAGASEFAIVDEKLCDALLHGEEVSGRLQVTIGGKAYTGNIEHHAHDHEGHDDDGHDHEGHNH